MDCDERLLRKLLASVSVRHEAGHLRRYLSGTSAAQSASPHKGGHSVAGFPLLVEDQTGEPSVLFVHGRAGPAPRAGLPSNRPSDTFEGIGDTRCRTALDG